LQRPPCTNDAFTGAGHQRGFTRAACRSSSSHSIFPSATRASTLTRDICECCLLRQASRRGGGGIPICPFTNTQMRSEFPDIVIRSPQAFVNSL
jgi:hypothetical protein